MNRLTKRTQKGAALKLDNPRTEKEARKQLHDKYLLAIEKLAAYEDTGLTPEEIMDGKMLTGWIPCSERLPETSGKYLVSRTDYDGFNDRIVHPVEIFEINIEDKYDTEFFKIEVDAWQPLPEPWEGDKE